MRRITTNNKVEPGSLFTDETDGGNVTPTSLNAMWFNNVQEEICNAITLLGSRVNTETQRNQDGTVEYRENYNQLGYAIQKIAESACPLGSLKAFANNNPLNHTFLARWAIGNESITGVHWFSAEMARNCEQVDGNEGGFYYLTRPNVLLKWADCDGTFPLPASSEENVWTREDIEEVTGQSVEGNATLQNAVGKLKPTLITNLNGNINEEVFLAGSVNPGGSTTTTRHILSLTEITSSAAFSARSSHRAVVFKGAMYVIGGYSNGVKNDVWKSTNGRSWEDVTPSNSIFSPRTSPQAVVFNNAMYIIGGYSYGYKNDVWKSTDGKNWQEVTSNANFSPRYAHQASGV